MTETKISEASFQRTVIEMAELLSWRTYHTHDSRRSNQGWPDLVLVRAGELVIVELKTNTGRLSQAQGEWLDDLEASGVEVHVWRPRDFDRIEARLKGLWKPTKEESSWRTRTLESGR